MYGGYGNFEVSCTGDVVITVVCMLCVMMTVIWNDAERSASLR